MADYFGYTLPGTYVEEDVIWEANPSLPIPYAFGVLSNEYVEAEGRSHYALRMGDATSGSLTTAYDDYTEIEFALEGSIILGVGGDNSNWSYGTFFEGAITTGRPTETTDQAIHENVKAAGYGQ